MAGCVWTPRRRCIKVRSGELEEVFERIAEKWMRLMQLFGWTRIRAPAQDDGVWLLERKEMGMDHNGYRKGVDGTLATLWA